LLLQLKAKGLKIVHLKAKDSVTTLPQYDTAIVKARAGQTADARPTTNRRAHDPGTAIAAGAAASLGPNVP
jgi:hypothetical protein